MVIVASWVRSRSEHGRQRAQGVGESVCVIERSHDITTILIGGWIKEATGGTLSLKLVQAAVAPLGFRFARGGRRTSEGVDDL